MAGLEFIGRHQPAFLDHMLECRKPDLVVAHRQIFGGRPILAGKARHVDVPCAGHAHGQRQCERPFLPFVVKYRFVRLEFDWTEAVLAAHVLRAVHFRSFGDFGNPVPIMESRVTSSASFSSLQPSVPAGRIGTTR